MVTALPETEAGRGQDPTVAARGARGRLPREPAAGGPREAGPGPHPVWRVGTCPALSAASPPSVVLLLALHLCVFTMFGMLLFTGEKVPAASAALRLVGGRALGEPASRGPCRAALGPAGKRAARPAPGRGEWGPPAVGCPSSDGHRVLLVSIWL